MQKPRSSTTIHFELRLERVTALLLPGGTQYVIPWLDYPKWVARLGRDRYEIPYLGMWRAFDLWCPDRIVQRAT